MSVAPYGACLIHALQSWGCALLRSASPQAIAPARLRREKVNGIGRLAGKEPMPALPGTNAMFPENGSGVSASNRRRRRRRSNNMKRCEAARNSRIEEH